MKNDKSSLVLAFIGVACVLMGGMQTCNGKVKDSINGYQALPENSFERVSVDGHSYIFIYLRSGHSGIVHDPECKKCRNEFQEMIEDIDYGKKVEVKR